jgi:hypothetical protein
MDRRFVSAKRGRGNFLLKSDVTRGADALNRLTPRNRRGSAGCFIGPQNTPAFLGATGALKCFSIAKMGVGTKMSSQYMHY